MLLEERLKLRNELIDEFLELHIIREYQNMYQKNGNHVQGLISNCTLLDSDLKQKYLSYVNEFRTELEAIYCILHITDFTDHICPICKSNLAIFRSKKPNIRYATTCGGKDCLNKQIHTDEAKKKQEDTNLLKYGFKSSAQNSAVKAKAVDTNLKRYGYSHPSKSNKIKQKIAKKFINKYGYKCSLQNTKVNRKARISCFNKYGTYFKAQCNITNYEIWCDNCKMKQFIIDEYNKKGSPLLVNDISKIFTVGAFSLRRKIKLLNLSKYFFIQEPSLEPQFRIFLEDNNIEYSQHNRNILYDNKTKHYKEIDFLIDKIGFEINDIETHKCADDSCSKDKMYHYNKSMRASINNIRLIHIWEWELNETYWPKISQWILHILNQNKIQLTLDNCDIRKVTKENELKFLNQYSVSSYQESDTCIGIYYNNELIQTISFKEDILSICVKFGFNIIKETKDIIESYMQSKQLSSLTTYVDLSKFTGKTFEGMGFELDYIIEPRIIYNDQEKNRIIYNSGYKVFKFKI